MLRQYEPSTLENIAMLTMFHNVSVTLMTIATYGMVVIAILTLGLWLIYSQRIFGPSVPIRRHIAHLREGKYDVRINLRKNDEFKDVAEDLNALAETLSER